MKTPITKAKYNILKGNVQTTDPREYNESWYIFKIGAGGDDGFNLGMLEGDFVSNIFGSLGQGVNVANVFLTGATELSDANGNPGKISIKNLGFSPTANMEVESFFPKFLWKGFLNAYSNNYFDTDKTMYIMYKDYPETDKDGLITNSSAYLVYAHQDRNNKGKFVHTQITMSFLDSNVAKDGGGDKYIQFNFSLNPTIPKNAKYLEIIPTTPSIIDPYNVQIRDGDNNLTTGMPVEREGFDYSRWILDRIRWYISGQSIKITSPWRAEYEFQANIHFWEIINPGGLINGNLDSANRPSGLIGINNFILDEDGTISDLYNRHTIDTQIKLTTGSLLHEEYKEYLTTKYKMGGDGSNATSFPSKFNFDENDEPLDGSQVGIINRTTANWKLSDRYYINDIYAATYREGSSVLFTGVAEQLWYHHPQYGPDYDTEEKRIKLFMNIVGGKKTIPGGSMTQQMLRKSVHNAEADITDIVDNDGWVYINMGEDQGNIYIPTSFAYVGMTIHKDNVGAAATARVINPDTTYPMGGVEVIANKFSNAYRDDEVFYKDRILYEVYKGDGTMINEVSTRRISGNFIMIWRDKDMNLCVGDKEDGTEIEIPAQEIKAPQSLDPFNNEFRIVYIGV